MARPSGSSAMRGPPPSVMAPRPPPPSMAPPSVAPPVPTSGATAVSGPAGMTAAAAAASSTAAAAATGHGSSSSSSSSSMAGGGLPPMPPSREAVRAAELAMAQAALEAYATPAYAGKYVLQKLIGKGAYGAVYVAEDTSAPAGSPSRKVAIKHIVNAFVSPTDARRIYREIKVMAHFAHPNIVQLIEVVRPRDIAGFSHIYLVAELMETDLHRVIHSRQDLTSDHISYFVYQTLCALKHIHTAGVLHRDLKPSNLLVNADCTVKMCDFGLARESEPSMSAAFTEYVVTRWYRAPEVLLSGGRYKTSVDVWSVGCVLAELLLRRPLFPGDNYLHQLQLITEILGSPAPEDLHFVRSEAARSFMTRLPRYDGVSFAKLFPLVRGPCLDLLQRMLAFNPDARISVDDALAHPFLARVRTARRHFNEDSVSIPRPFKLRIPGGSAGLRAMSVEAIKGRFYAELCGIVSPSPGVAPIGGLFSVAALAHAGMAGGGGGGVGEGMDVSATPADAGGDVDDMPAEWDDGCGGGGGGGIGGDDGGDYYEDEDDAMAGSPVRSRRSTVTGMDVPPSPSRPPAGGGRPAAPPAAAPPRAVAPTPPRR